MLAYCQPWNVSACLANRVWSATTDNLRNINSSTHELKFSTNANDFYRIPVWGVNIANVIAIAVIKFRTRSLVFLYVQMIMTVYIQYSVLDYRKLFATWPKIQLSLKCFWGPLAAERSLRTPEWNDTEREREEERSVRCKECEQIWG